MIIRLLAFSALLLTGFTGAEAATDSQKCEAARLKLAGQYSLCLLKAEAVGILKSAAPDDTKCAAAQAKYGAECPLPADCASIRTIAECSSDQLPIPIPTTTTTTMPACGVNASLDVDEDGFTGSAGDCDDCNDLVNPGALEIAANGEDDDCDGTTDNVLASCDSGLLLASTDALEGAGAIGLCQQASMMDSKWGILSAAYVRSNGAAAAPGSQAGLSDSFGPNVSPFEGSRLLVLSTGRARSASQPDACGSISCAGLGAGTAPPGFPQSIPFCPTGSSVHDDIGLQVQLRVPTNAVGYRFRLNYYAFDYPGFVCSNYNDQFVALASPPPMGSANGNVSFDATGAPFSVNSTLRSCEACAEGTAELAGTGFDTYGTSPAGATSWLVTQAPATSGSTITLRFAIYDVGDGDFDSTVLLDGFEWITSGPVFVGTTVVP
jgi:hypothetical protein